MSSGETLRQHHLREVETILEVSARLCVGRAAAKLHGDRIDDPDSQLGESVPDQAGAVKQLKLNANMKVALALSAVSLDSAARGV